MTKTPSSELSRRKFISHSSAALGATAFGPFILRGKNLNSKINVAAIGAGGKGSSDTDNNARCGANIVALCDVDLGRLRARGEKYPGAATYQDFRKMLEKEKSIDAVSVSTPDHMHAVAAITAHEDGQNTCTSRNHSPSPSTRHASCARWPRNRKWPRRWATRAAPGAACDAPSQVIQSGIIGDVH